jgi:MFS superfamily sulfate permease-like transporter
VAGLPVAVGLYTAFTPMVIYARDAIQRYQALQAAEAASPTFS